MRVSADAWTRSVRPSADGGTVAVVCNEVRAIAGVPEGGGGYATVDAAEAVFAEDVEDDVDERAEEELLVGLDELCRGGCRIPVRRRALMCSGAQESALSPPRAGLFDGEDGVGFL